MAVTQQAKATKAAVDLPGDLTPDIGTGASEGAGVREGVLKHCDFRLGIPMLGQVGSLNASVSAAILLYEAARQRGARSSV